MIFNEQTAQRVVNALATSLKKVFDAAFEAAEKAASDGGTVAELHSHNVTDTLFCGALCVGI